MKRSKVRAAKALYAAEELVRAIAMDIADTMEGILDDALRGVIRTLNITSGRDALTKAFMLVLSLGGLAWAVLSHDPDYSTTGLMLFLAGAAVLAQK